MKSSGMGLGEGTGASIHELAGAFVPAYRWPRKMFAAGKLTRRSAEILLAEQVRRVSGPFVLRGIVGAARTNRSIDGAAAASVH